MDTSRRHFLKVATLTSGSLFIGTMFSSHINGQIQKVQEDNQLLVQGIEINQNSEITIHIFKQEMGQGILTGLAMAVADELDADWEKVSIKHMVFSYDKQPSDKIHRYDTGGSTSVFTEFLPMRELGATAKDLLIRAAASIWKLPQSVIYSHNNEVLNSKNGGKLAYGELVKIASTLDICPNINLKTNKQFSLLGKPIASKKVHDIVSGKYDYGIDNVDNNYYHAMIIRPPVLGATVKTFNAKYAKKVPGVLDVYKLNPIESDTLFFKGIRGGIVIIATDTWAAIQARELVKITWTRTNNSNRHSDGLWQELDEFHQKKPPTIMMQHGDVDKLSEESNRVVSAQYTSPYIAHGLMEPLNAVAKFSVNDTLDIWAGTQSPFETTKNISHTLSIAKENITIHPCSSGGGYGRRYFTDYVLETVLIAQKHKGQAIKLIWTREDEIQFDSYHPLRVDNCYAVLNHEGMASTFAIDAISTHEWKGMVIPWFYHFDNLRFRSWYFKDKLVQFGSWRAVVLHLDVFSRECFMDELAFAANADPLAYRILHCQKKPPVPQEGEINVKKLDIEQLQALHLRGFEQIKVLSGWNKKREKNTGLGVATIAYHNKSFCTLVAEVQVINKKIKVKTIYCVADIGFVLNPNLVKGQIESSILWGLTPVLYGGIDVKFGEVVQSNFHDMRIAKNNDCPEIVIHLEDHFKRPPSGAGEFAVPPVAPAILNAVFAATGKRLRHMQLPKEMVS